MKYIAALDYKHLDNAVFLTAVGRALAKQQGVRSVIVHGESEYTERLIQTGIMRKEASIRCIKDLNHRLVALFADQGVAAIGLNGFQRELITLKKGELHLDQDYFKQLPPRPVLLLSNLVLDAQSGQPVPVALHHLIAFLAGKISPDEIFLFAESDTPESETEKTLPADFEKLAVPARITTAPAFGNLPDLSGSIPLGDL